MNARLNLEHTKANVGRLVRSYRLYSNFKSDYVAKKLGISLGNYSKLENGKIELTDSRLKELCKVFKITPPEFYLHFTYNF